MLIDIPKDIQQHYPKDSEGNYASPDIPAMIDMPERKIAGIEALQLQEACRLINESERPVIYAGGGKVTMFVTYNALSY